MQRLDVHRLEGVGARCFPRDRASCGGVVPYAATTCPDCKQRQNRTAPEVNPADLLHDVMLHDADTGEPIALATRVSAHAAGFVSNLGAQFANIKIRSATSHIPQPRLSGLGDRQAMFGTVKPMPLRRRYGCRRSEMTRATNADDWLAVTGELQSTLAQHLPAVAARNIELAEPIADIWKWDGTGWTSGVVNYTQRLPYHRDAGNLRGSWSAMIGARSAATGGHLHLPDYGVTIAVDNRSLLCFAGGDIAHGVTPMVVRPTGFRVTAVFYGLSGVKPCAPTYEAERIRGAQRSTDAARLMAKAAPHDDDECCDE